nr:hypothetical protein [Tanacetum cinerariifolium]
MSIRRIGRCGIRRLSSRNTKALSESEGSTGGHWKSRPKRQKSSVKDDLSQPWVYEETGPFTPQIRYFDFPKTRMPSHIKTYDGSEDPEDHLKIFQAAAKTEQNPLIVTNLQLKKCIKDPVEIHNIKQRDEQSTEEFVRRGEVAASNRERKKLFPSWVQQEAGQKQNFKKGSFQNQQRTERRQDKFTLLTKTPKEILALDKEVQTSSANDNLDRKKKCYKFTFSHNGIIGRPRIKRIQEIPSTDHIILKFLVMGGTVTLRSSKFIPLECTIVSALGIPQLVIDQVREDKI